MAHSFGTPEVGNNSGVHIFKDGQAAFDLRDYTFLFCKWWNWQRDRREVAA